MDAMVSARVPVEIKKQGDQKLKEIGSTVTELVNAAYQYVLAYGKLPDKANAELPLGPQVKTLSGEQAAVFKAQWSRYTMPTPVQYDGTNFKELLNKSRDEYYARLA